MLAVACCFAAPDTLRPGDDLAQKVAAAAEGAQFVIAAGTHRMAAPIIAKDGQKFEGELAPDGKRLTVLSGSILLDSSRWAQDGQHWVYQDTVTCAECTSDDKFKYCPENLYKNGAYMRQVNSLNAADNADKWFMDFSAKKIYVKADPRSAVMEFSVATAAFYGEAFDVTIKNFKIEKFATPLKGAAVWRTYFVDSTTQKAGWTVVNNEIAYNHCEGLRLHTPSKLAAQRHIVLNNYIHHSGKLGALIHGGNGHIIMGNEFTQNALSGMVSQGGEAGGLKMMRNWNMRVMANYAHRNGANGFWTDAEVDSCNIDLNVSEYNGNNGLFHESEGVKQTFRCNISRLNGKDGAWVYGAQVMLSHTSYGDVSHNAFVVDGSFGQGIVVLYQPQDINHGLIDSIWWGRVVYPPKHNNIHHNTVHLLGSRGRIGVINDGVPAITRWTDNPDKDGPPACYPQCYQDSIDLLYSGKSNTFDNNHYHMPNTDAQVWSYPGYLDWNGFRGLGFEQNGSIDKNATGDIDSLIAYIRSCEPCRQMIDTIEAYGYVAAPGPLSKLIKVSSSAKDRMNKMPLAGNAIPIEYRAQYLWITTPRDVGPAVVSLFNARGRRIYKVSLDTSKRTHRISLARFPASVCIARLRAGGAEISKWFSCN
jgi:hypothetical protein